MPSFTCQRFVPYTAHQMFALVADVEKYPEFLFMCDDLSLRSREDRGPDVLLVADMTVGYKLIHERFTTRVLLKEQENRIEVSYIEGPFRYLENVWNFHDVEGGCVVEFYIDYAFKSRLLGALMGSVFDSAFNKLSYAFEQRADRIYGTQKIKVHDHKVVTKPV